MLFRRDCCGFFTAVCVFMATLFMTAKKIEQTGVDAGGIMHILCYGGRCRVNTALFPSSARHC